MPIKGFIQIVVAVICFGCPVLAGEQIGICGLQSFTDHRRVPSPAGVGAFVQKDLSHKVSLRFSLQKGFDFDSYVKTIRYGGIFSQPGDTIHDFWNQESSMSAYDLTLLFKPFKPGVVNLSVGVGLGIVALDFSAVGRSSGYEMSDDANSRMGFSGLLDFEIAPPNLSPALLHVMIRERIAPDNESYATDGIYYLAGSISSAEISLSIALKL